MSEQKKDSLVQKQKQAKPKIEEVIPTYFDGESNQTIVEFLEFCRANEIKCKWSATNRWKIVFKGEGIGMVYIGKSPCVSGGDNFEKNLWYIHVGMEKELIEKENLTEIIYNNVLTFCARMNRSAPCRDSVTILGKEFHGICPESGNRFMNPDTETLDCLKKQIELKIGRIIASEALCKI